MLEEHRRLEGSGSWEAVPLTQTIQDWVTDAHKNFGLMLKATRLAPAADRESDLVRRHPPNDARNKEAPPPHLPSSPPRLGTEL